MRQDQLMLNDDKTEFLIIGTRQQLSKVSIQSIKVGQAGLSSSLCAQSRHMVRCASRYGHSYYKDM